MRESVKTMDATTRQPAPDLLIVVVNYRTPAMTCDCLRSLESEVRALPERVRVVVVDNGSGDGSAEALREAMAAERWQNWVELLVLEENLGFAGGNNRGIARHPNARDVLLLNSDTLMHAGTLRHCLDALHARRDVGALACRLLSRDGSPQTMARPFPTPLRQTAATLGLPWHWPSLFGWADLERLAPDHHTRPRRVDWLGGAFVLLRGEALRQVGLLDETFFFYGEDIELCHRLHRAGWRCWYDPTVTLTHFGGGSSDPARIDDRRRNTAFWQARYLVQRQCYGRLAATWLRSVDLIACSLRLLALRCRGRAQSPRYAQTAELWRMLRKPLTS